MAVSRFLPPLGRLRVECKSTAFLVFSRHIGALTEEPVSLGRKMSTNKDDKSFLIAPLFDGQRGPMFLAWSKKFLDAAEGKGNEDFSYADVFRAW